MSSENHAGLSPIKQAFLALEKAQARIVALEKARDERAQSGSAHAEPIAIVGMACRMPGDADTPADFWRLIRDGVDAIREVPTDRWDNKLFYDPDPAAPNKISSRHGAFVRDVKGFDAEFFGISQREAVSMDPQHRMLLETAWEAIEDAGVAPDRLYNQEIGVFIGIATFDYSVRMLGSDQPTVDPFVGLGNTHSAAAGRISYFLGLQGPCVAMDTACSSSLVALHEACQAIRAGECKAAFAGGVNALLSPLLSVNFTKARMLSPDGRCKTFDAAADGYVRGEGAGMVFLKKLSDALADGDRVWAVLRGTAVNQDGPSGGLTVPNGPAQEAVIRRALAVGGVAPQDVGYIEAHGTGTQLGDPIELGALQAVFGKARKRPLMIGSVKTNIGHLEASAGIAGVIKTIYMVRQGETPPHLHFHKPNPYANWGSGTLEVPTRLAPWPSDGRRRIAGVSSFGFTGTNAHVVVEEAPPTVVPPDDGLACALAISARTPAALAESCRRLAEWLRGAEGQSTALADVAWTLSDGRAPMMHRLTIVARDKSEAIESLDLASHSQTDSRTRVARVAPGKVPAIGLWLPGDVDPGETDLEARLVAFPAFAAAWEKIQTIVGPEFDATRATNGAARAFALGWAVGSMWKTSGLDPLAVAGDGGGAIAARCLQGELSLSDGWRAATALANTASNLPPTWNGVAVETTLVAGKSAENAATIPSLLRDTSVDLALASAQARLETHGVRVRVATQRKPVKLSLPTYPFERHEFWVAPGARATMFTQADGGFAIHPLVGAPQITQDGKVLFLPHLQAGQLAYLQDHRFGETAVYPASAYVESAFAVGGRGLPDSERGRLRIEDLDLLRALPLSAARGGDVQVTAEVDGNRRRLEMASVAPNPAGGAPLELLHATCEVELAPVASTPSTAHPLVAALIADQIPADAEQPDIAGIYRDFVGRGLRYDERFQALRRVAMQGEVVACETKLPDSIAGGAKEYVLHPVLLDACFQALLVRLQAAGEGGGFLPVRFERIVAWRKAGATAFGQAMLRTKLPAPGEPAIDAIVADVDMFDDQGQAIARLEGMRLQRVTIDIGLAATNSAQSPESLLDTMTPLRAALVAETTEARRTKVIAFLQENLVKLLKQDDAGPPEPTANLFQVGVDSLVAVEWIYEINRALGIRLPVETLLVRTTIAQLADELDKWIVATPGTASSVATETTPLSPWIGATTSRPKAEKRLFCFHHLGGDSTLFAGWSDALTPRIELLPIQLPGRGARADEPAITDFSRLIDELADALLDYLDRPFAFFGNSAGNQVAYELAQLLRRRFGLQPERLFVGASWSPAKLTQRAAATIDERLDWVKELLGPTAIDPPAERKAAIQDDLALFASWRPSTATALDCGLTAFGGKEDLLVGRDDLLGWSATVRGDFRLEMTPGAHTTWLSHWPRIARAIARDLFDGDETSP